MKNEWKRDPYCNEYAEAYVTAINILAVEYLIKHYNWDEYCKWGYVVNSLTDEDLICLQVALSFNCHTSSLGAMITHGDYEHQRERLMAFLEEHLDKED